MGTELEIIINLVEKKAISELKRDYRIDDDNFKIEEQMYMEKFDLSKGN